MPTCTRLTYASTAVASAAHIRDDLNNILKKAHANNAQNQIFGVLFYGNNLFFQCIEGQKKDIDDLFEKISQDPRHTDIKILSYERIAKPMFYSWEMKFVRNEDNVREFCSQNHWEIFNPYALEGQLSIQFLEFLYVHEQPESFLDAMADAQKDSLSQWYKYILTVGVLGLILLGGLYLTFQGKAGEAMHLL